MAGRRHIGVDHGADDDRNIVTGDDLLRRDLDGLNAGVHDACAIDAERQQHDQARPGQALAGASQAKHHAPLVLAQHAHAGQQRNASQNKNSHEQSFHAALLLNGNCDTVGRAAGQVPDRKNSVFCV